MEYLNHQMTDGISILTIKREEHLNALSTAILQEIHYFLEVTASELKPKVLILTGSGDKAFSAGADIKELSSMNQRQVNAFLNLGNQVADDLEKAPFITIAAVNGYALGLGLELALGCDFIYASDTAELGFPEIELGLIPGFGGTQRLEEAVGRRYAKEMVLSGQRIIAKEAAQRGLVNHTCPKDLLIDVCVNAAKKMSSFSQVALRAGKSAIGKGPQAERKEFLRCFDTPERIKAMQSITEKDQRCSACD
ncbi:MAG: enoyl-CoA hydratase-related protein [Waddliaceae bacterium]